MCIVGLMSLNPVDKDYVKWLDAKALARESSQTGKGDDQRPFRKSKFDKGYSKINWQGSLTVEHGTHNPETGVRLPLLHPTEEEKNKAEIAYMMRNGKRKD